MAMRWMTMVMGLGLFAGLTFGQDTAALKTDKNKISYALGMDLGNQLKRQSVDVDPDIFVQGLNPENSSR